MKRTLTILLALFLFVFAGCSDSRSWYANEPEYSKSYDSRRDSMADLGAAKKKATAEKKNVLLLLGGDWCSWCHLLNNFLDANREVSGLLLKNFVLVKVNVSDSGESNELVNNLPAIKGVPHFFVMSPSGELILSQDTSELEEGRGYNKEKFIAFINAYGAK